VFESAYLDKSNIRAVLRDGDEVPVWIAGVQYTGHVETEDNERGEWLTVVVHD